MGVNKERERGSEWVNERRGWASDGSYGRNARGNGSP